MMKKVLEKSSSESSEEANNMGDAESSQSLGSSRN